jgi:hypothetical protein
MILRHLVTEADIGAVNAAAAPPPSPLQLNSLYLSLKQNAISILSK